MSAHVVVVGGGYGGLRAVEHLANDPAFRITLVDANPYHYLQTEAYGYIAGRFDIHEVTIDLANWCSGFSPKVEFLHEKALRFDTDSKTLTTENRTLSYDYLIVAVGAHTNFFEFIAGLREHSYGVKVLQRAFAFRSMFETLIYEKVCESRHNGDESLHIAIGGAGLSGVEIAAEMAEVIQRNYRTLGTNAQRIKIRLIDAAPTILPGMSPYIIDKTRRRLESLGIEILTNAFIDRVGDDVIRLKDGTALPYRFMIFTGGIKAHTLASDAPLTLNRILQLQPDARLNVGGKADVFAIGDCVELKDANGKLLPPTAQTAEKSAEYVAQSIKQQLKGEEPKSFHARVDGVFVALGGHYAVGELFGFIRVKGYKAYLLKKLITKSYHLGLKLRINTGFRKRTSSAA